MNTLPLELITIILSNMDLETLLNMALVNKNFYIEMKRITCLTLTFYPDTTMIKSKEWNDKQETKRVVKYRKDGSREIEVWLKHDKLNRLNGPAKQGWYANGYKEYEWWFNNDKRHRLDGPADQRWHENGQKEDERWLQNGERHRLDGPAKQKWYENGQKWYELWYNNNKLHRLDGPAEQNWYPSGSKRFIIWYVNGNKSYHEVKVY